MELRVSKGSPTDKLWTYPEASKCVPISLGPLGSHAQMGVWDFVGGFQIIFHR